jgi:uracil-DNA glycosylase
MTNVNPAIDDSWRAALHEEFEKPYFAKLKEFLVAEKKQYAVYPPGPLIFNAFNTTPFDEVKVVLIGQDPYHGSGQAHGLSFSVPDGVRPPPSLVNIFKELHNDLDIPIPRTGNLTPWAERGVLLLNATLTVRAAQPGSHQNQGWEEFTNSVICRLSEHKEGLVFLLWGKFAQAKEVMIDTTKHFILKAAHPSPFSASNGFFGCKHFSKTNRILKEHGLKEIDWRVG